MNKWLRKITVLTSAVVLGTILLTACGKKQDTDQAQSPAETVAEKEKEVQEVIEETANNEILQDFIGEMDLEGSWDDEVSQRASMDITKNEDGSYNILVHWGGSATETAIWEIHGTYDETSGMLSYEDGKYSIHTFESDGKETVSGEQTTKGAFMKEGEKLRWTDSMNSDDGLFVKQ